jgi:hypothetical protein
MGRKRKREAEVLPELLQMSDDVWQLVTSLRELLVGTPFFVTHEQIDRSILEWQPHLSHAHVDMFRDKDDVLRPCAFVDLHCCTWLHQGLFAAPCGFDSYEEPISYHGTHSFDSFKEILHCRGIMRDSIPERSEGRHIGWYHAGDNFEKAVSYAGPTMAGGIPCRIVLKFYVACCNSCGTGRYTGHRCQRYRLTGVYAVPLYVIPRHIQCYAQRPYCRSFDAFTSRSLGPTTS